MAHKIRIMNVIGGFFDVDKPEDFNMGVFVMSIRGNGYLMTQDFFVPADKIVSIFVFDPDDQPVPGEAPLAKGNLQ